MGADSTESEADLRSGNGKPVLFICEKYYLRFYRPVAARLAALGFRPIWVAVDGLDEWDYEYMDPCAAIEGLTEGLERPSPVSLGDELCVFERVVFTQPDVFRGYSYTMNVVRTPERARRLAEVWYGVTLALVMRFRPRAVCVWNGRYLPYSAVSAACEAAGQLLLTSEIGWIPGTIFLDRGVLSTTTTDLLGRSFESPAAGSVARADAFLHDYTSEKATMVAQRMVSPPELRQRLLGDDGRFLLLYGCQVDWDTNVVIGARRFRSNEAAVSFLMDCLNAVPNGRIVVKTHPLDSEKKDDVLRAIIGHRGAVVTDVHPHALIEAADCVSVRNSTLGFEALCYQKPLLLLEDAKYRHPQLTLEARDAAHGAASLTSVASGNCTLPDRSALRQFISHLLDRYLLPAPYRYHFEPQKLDILSHFGHNDGYRALEEVLRDAPSPAQVHIDDDVLQAVHSWKLQRRSFLFRHLQKTADWFRAAPGRHT